MSRVSNLPLLAWFDCYVHVSTSVNCWQHAWHFCSWEEKTRQEEDNEQEKPSEPKAGCRGRVGTGFCWTLRWGGCARGRQINMEGGFRHVCEKSINKDCQSTGFLGVSEAMFLLMFSFKQFHHIQLPYTLIWLLQSCPNGRWILALVRSFAGWGKDASRGRQWRTAALRAKSVSGWLQGPCRVPFSLGMEVYWTGKPWRVENEQLYMCAV